MVEIKVYDKKLNFLGLIDDFVSFTWHRKFYEAGSFDLILLTGLFPVQYFAIDNIYMIDGKNEAAIVEIVKADDDGTDSTIHIAGRFLSSILDRRIVKTRLNFNGTIANGMKLLLIPTYMTPFSILDIGSGTPSSDSIVFQCTYKNTYSQLNKLSLLSGIGFRITPNLVTKRLVFELYLGTDRTSKQSAAERYSFKDSQDNIEQAEYLFTRQDEKNWGLVGGQGEGVNRVTQIVDRGTFTDFNLRETFIDARDLTQDELTMMAYLQALTTRGMESLELPLETFEVLASSFDYRIKWDLGDIVDVEKEQWGIKIEKRIGEVIEVYEENAYQVTPVFQEKQLTADLSDD